MTGESKTTPPLDSDDWIERFASALPCPRHIPQMRACRYQNGEPCHCRGHRDFVLAELAQEAASDR